VEIVGFAVAFRAICFWHYPTLSIISIFAISFSPPMINSSYSKVLNTTKKAALRECRIWGILFQRAIENGVSQF
jgi:hypothetical protein